MTYHEFGKYISPLKEIKCFYPFRVDKFYWHFYLDARENGILPYFTVMAWIDTNRILQKWRVKGRKESLSLEEVIASVPSEIGMELLFHIDLLQTKYKWSLDEQLR